MTSNPTTKTSNGVPTAASGCSPSRAIIRPGGSGSASRKLRASRPTALKPAPTGGWRTSVFSGAPGAHHIQTKNGPGKPGPFLQEVLLCGEKLTQRFREDHTAVEIATVDRFIFAGHQDERVAFLFGDLGEFPHVIRQQQLIGVHAEAAQAAVRRGDEDDVILFQLADQQERA